MRVLQAQSLCTAHTQPLHGQRATFVRAHARAQARPQARAARRADRTLVL
jgi:hypothetical protein